MFSNGFSLFYISINNNDNVPVDRNILTLESVTSSEFKNECNQLASFTSDYQDHNYLDQIEIKKI